MPIAEEMKEIAENSVSSFEARIQSIGSIFDTTHELLEGFQDSFLDAKQEKEKFNAQIRDILSENEHFRKTDFDNMMQGALSSQDEREKGVRDLLKRYLDDQKEMAQALRKNLNRFTESLAKGEALRIKEFQETMKTILAEQDERKNEITNKLKEFQKEQQEMSKRLKGLLAKGRVLRIKDVKLMLKEFNAQRKDLMSGSAERIKKNRLLRSGERKERRKTVHHMLGGFNNRRVTKTNELRLNNAFEVINKDVMEISNR